MEPKAKWRLLVDKHIWMAVVGPYELFVNANNGVCDLSWRDDATESSGNTIWTKTQPTPCDVTDLMRLTEAELARRLTSAAETMDGRGLVADALAAGLAANELAEHNIDESDCGNCHQADCVECDRGLSTAVAALTKPRFKVGDRVSVYCYTAAKRVLGTVTHYNTETRRYTVDNDLGMWGVFDSDNVEPAQPRLKVGDLVHIRSRYLIGRVTEVDLDIIGDEHCHVDVGGESRSYPSINLTPYTLPPINSYADLADVLDELPDGVVVEVSNDASTVPVSYRKRAGRFEWQFSDTEWRKAWELTRRDPIHLVPSASVRILPPSEVNP